MQCVQLVYEELRKIIYEIDLPETNRFPNFRKRLNEEMKDFLIECLFPTNQMVKNLITI